ncbi:DUF4340 domain-containing protein [Leptospira sp. 'Mane']|uniref:DUF4340 domain-containing protein n=1 Tax=Leptospira sp. 'Mane' TaxID=3387407 RepID=UPI00398B9C3F
MKKANKTFLFLNLVLILLIILVYDVFHFFPKAYEEARPWLGEKAFSVDSVFISVKEFGAHPEKDFSIFKNNNIWHISLTNEENPKSYFVDSEKINSLLNELSRFRKFGKSVKELNDSEFRKDGKSFRLLLKENNNKIADLELGDCFEIKSECLIRHSNTKLAYSVPIDFIPQIGGGEFDFFLTAKPFSFLSIENLESFTYMKKNVVLLDLKKEGDVWISLPASENKLSKTKVDNLLLRVVSLAGVSGMTESSLGQLKLKDTNGDESLRLVLAENGSKKEYGLLDRGSLNQGERVLQLSPNGQYVVMPSYVWDYWQNFDIRQLEE